MADWTPMDWTPMADWTVLKMGGSLQGAGLAALASAIAWCQQSGQNVAVVHGGGPRISQALNEAGIDLPFVDGERVTTAAGMAVVERVLARDVNRELTASLQSAGIAAAGVSGADGVLEAVPLPGRERTARVGRVVTEPLERLAVDGLVPVMAPLGCDAYGLSYNINADLAAGAVAGALGAGRVVFLTDVPGIYENFEAKALLTDTSAEHLRQLLQAGRFHSGMIPKVNAVLSALAAGVQTAFVVDGADARALQWAVGDEVGAFAGAGNAAGNAAPNRLAGNEVAGAGAAATTSAAAEIAQTPGAERTFGTRVVIGRAG
ncbi:acetylglutamate kinase [Alicyclobacillus sp. ALC3]|uniref:acetylglutamate kinase n=1 Tax=Alicyclobacillus sp. ALC3 TaxID=2796143 RepID=UPI0023791330|nr:acetylglutamate kinase [Alicyclobacillus sp. ALC3]WDL97858.1 acetylglutamate kinase [Alicyclobacillus sp. ALC3]